jgi:LEA14-like dessication related protein
MKPLFSLCFPVCLLFCLLSCATPPPAEDIPAPPAAPALRLSFDRIQGADPGHIALFFNLELENPSPGGRPDLSSWRFRLNGLEQSAGAVLIFEGPGTPVGASVIFPVRLDLDMETIDRREDPAQNPAGGEYRAELEMNLRLDSLSGGMTELRAGAEAVFPRILEPRFSISSIAVRKAELINTRLKVRLRIDNPNPFPLELSALRYELYGAGRFWADGTEKDILILPADTVAEADLSLVMNFINMRRELLDEIIAMRQVRYRFAGEATVTTGVEYLPQVRTSFDRAGDAPVIE